MNEVETQETRVSLDSSPPVDIENGLLFKWRHNSKIQKRLHHASHGYYKCLSDASVFTSIALSLAVGCINLVYGVGPSATVVNTPAIVSGCLSLVAGSTIACSNTMQWNLKSVLHDEYSTRYSEIVRDINTETMLVKMNDRTFASQGEFIKHISSTLDRLEDHAPPIPGIVERMRQEKSTLSNGD